MERFPVEVCKEIATFIEHEINKTTFEFTVIEDDDRPISDHKRFMSYEYRIIIKNKHFKYKFTLRNPSIDKDIIKCWDYGSEIEMMYDSEKTVLILYDYTYGNEALNDCGIDYRKLTVSNIEKKDFDKLFDLIKINQIKHNVPLY